MNKLDIKFGTDGWRAKIADRFTFENVTRVATGMAQYLRKSTQGRNNIYIGFDRRFLSEDFAKTVASVFAFHEFQVFLTNTFTPTPVLSFKANQDPKAVGAVVITASHNPPTYNGIKFKEHHGCSALKATTDAFENEINALTDVDVPCDLVFASYIEKRKILRVNLVDDYKRTILGLIDAQAIKDAKFKVGVDVMFGSGSGYFKEILESLNVDVTEIHNQENPSFGGVAPEPVEKNLRELSKLVKDQNLDGGFATDGDGDRLGAVDTFGKSFTTQMILSCVYYHWLNNKKKSWTIARSVSTTRMVDLIAEKFGQTCIETPVGFKFIAEEMVQGNAQIGGEESGGVGVDDFIPERDGIFTALMLLEMMALENKKLHELYEHICNEIRPYQFVRNDLHLPKDQMDQAMQTLQNDPPQEFSGRKVERIETMDGFKFYLEDGSWVLIRPSGTEPIFRLYAESDTLASCQELLATAQEIMG